MTALITSLLMYTTVEVVAALPPLAVTVRSTLYWFCTAREYPGTVNFLGSRFVDLNGTRAPFRVIAQL